MSSAAIRRSSRLSVIAMAMLLAACSGPGGSPSEAAQSAVASAAASASAPTGSSAATISAAPTFAAGPLAPGTYEVGTNPYVRFTVDDGWSTSSTDPQAFDLQKDPAYVAFGVVAQVFTSGQDSTDAGTDPAAAAQLFASNTGLQVTAPQPVTIGGTDGVWFDVTTADPVPVFGFLSANGQIYRFAQDVKVRVNLISTGGQLLVFTVEAPPEHFDAALSVAQPVIESVTFG